MSFEFKMPIFGKKDNEKSPEHSENKTENLEKTPQELSGEFLKAEESGVMDKLKLIFDVLKPHEFDEMAAKIIGAFNIGSGIYCANIAFNHPEQMLVNDPTPGKVIALAVALLGATGVALGINKAYETVKYERKNEREVAQKYSNNN